ncbi:DUF349 domain-containing protein [Roseivirga pacifica]|uniref:DUF349 domain-containing protein n=1 Tax=Roseivirga pacifica TaxID=1267423 RepID=UPI003BAD41D3
MEYSEFGRVEDGKLIRKSFLDFPERVIGEVKETEEKTVAYFQERFAALQTEVEEIKKKVEENANKGSFMTKVKHLLDTLPEHDGLGAYETLHETLDKLYKELDAYITANRHKNLQIKTALLDELKPIAESKEWKSASAAVKEIQQKWIKTGAVAEEHKEAIEENFKTIIDDFYAKRAEFYADLEQMMEEKEKDFNDFLQNAEKKLSALKDTSAIKQSISQLTEEWKSLGKVKPKRHNELWEEFQGIIKKSLGAAKKVEKKKKAVSKGDSLKKKQAIVDQLKEANKSMVPTVDLKELKHAWKLAGKAPADLNEEYLFHSAMVSEKNFMAGLVEKKAKKGSSETDLIKLQLKVCRDLLERDKRELLNFQENLGKFNTSKGLDSLLDKKLQQQERKVKVKEAILSQIREANRSETAK